MADSEFPRPPRDDAEREACDNFDGEWCFNKGPRAFCTRRKGHTGKHVGATAVEVRSCLVWAEPWPAVPEASTPEPAGTKHRCATCERVQCPECMAPAPVATPAPDVRALVEAARNMVERIDNVTVESIDPDIEGAKVRLAYALAAACGSKEPT